MLITLTTSTPFLHKKDPNLLQLTIPTKPCVKVDYSPNSLYNIFYIQKFLSCYLLKTIKEISPQMWSFVQYL